MKKITCYIIINIFLASFPYILLGKQISMIITAPVTNLRACPNPAPENIKGPALSLDMKGKGLGQVSQLLFGEKILAEPFSEYPGWLEVDALEQRDHEGNPMKGYINKNHALEVPDFKSYNIVVTSKKAKCILFHQHLKKPVAYSIPFGTKLPGTHVPEKQYWVISFSNTLQGIISEEHVATMPSLNADSEDAVRKSIVQTAHSFVDTPYVWGGNSMHHPHFTKSITGIDCSNLIRQLYSMHQIDIPRNSRSQELRAKKIASGKQLKAGDAIFFTGTKNKQMCHVALYLGDDNLIEASGLLKNKAGKTSSTTTHYSPEEQKKLCVRVITAKEYLGKSIEELKNGMQIPTGIRKGATLYLGTFF